MRTFSVVYEHPESHGPQICVIHMLPKYSTDVTLLYQNDNSIYSSMNHLVYNYTVRREGGQSGLFVGRHNVSLSVV